MARNLTPRELDIWQAYRQTLPEQPTEIYFQVPIARVDPPAKYKTYASEEWWQEIQAFRADVMYRTSASWVLVELEEELNTEALGQIIAYRALWNQLNPGSPITEAVIVTAADDNRLHPALQAVSVQHALVNLLN